MKHEGFNPFNSVKDRIGTAMVDDALRDGSLRPGMVIVEPTSGNTGIGLAYAAVARGFRCVFTMPETMTLERRNMLRALGCRVVLTEGPKGMKGAIARGTIMGKLGNRAWMPSSSTIHRIPRCTTGQRPEIWTARTERWISSSRESEPADDHRRGPYLREKKPKIRIVAVEPARSPVLSGGEPSPHKQQGIGADSYPASSIPRSIRK